MVNRYPLPSSGRKDNDLDFRYDQGRSLHSKASAIAPSSLPSRWFYPEVRNIPMAASAASIDPRKLVEIVKTPRRASARVPPDLLPRCSLAQKSRVRAAAQESPGKHTPNYESQGPSLRTAPQEHIPDLLFAPAAHRLARGLSLEAAARSGERL